MPPVTQTSSSLGELYSRVVQMVNENKISTKNAFDLPLIENMDEIVESFMGGGPQGKKKRPSASAEEKSRPSEAAAGFEEHRFHEASCTIEASARIYACRVDCVHTDTYKVLGGLNSAGVGEDDDDGKEGEDGKGGAAKRRRIVGVNTLERNEANIIQQNLEKDEQSDPMFRRMAAAFDAGGAKGLLLSHLPVAEDMSLVFNGDVPMCRAIEKSRPMFEKPQQFPVDSIGLGDAELAGVKIAEARCCPEVDTFRQLLWGDVSNSVTLPPELERCFGPPPGIEPLQVDLGPVELPTGPAEELDFPEMPAPEPPGGPAPASAGAPLEPPAPIADRAAGAAGAQSGAVPLPLTDLGDGVPQALVSDLGAPSKREDVIAFDALFDKFCGVGSHEFAYFDECWGRGKEDRAGVLQDAPAEGQDGTLAVASTAAEGKEKPQKRPLFDVAGLDRPAKPIETEPVHKHQLSERAAQWQLHKDVPPYMVDRITMPSWPTWSKCDFGRLGLRPHLMLKLVRKPQPPGDGPFGFSDLFATQLVENPDAYPWLSGGSLMERALGKKLDSFDEDAPAEREVELGDDGAAGDDGGFGGSGLPAHLDVDPQDLFLRPDDKVVAGAADSGDMGGLDVDDNGNSMLDSAVDFDLVDLPNRVGSTDIGYSRNSKFVDVKLVKKHLWDCINDDIAAAKAAESKAAETSFQSLVQRTVRKMPKSEMENLSIQVCFICALHICNEKGVELACDDSKPLGDFLVVAQP